MVSMLYNLARIAQAVRRVTPRSVLDVGCTFGMFGVICRECLDILPGRPEKKDWLTRIDAVGLVEITDLHRYVYDNIYEEDIWEFDWPIEYDLVFLENCVEYLTKSEAIQLLSTLKSPLVLISTPADGANRKIFTGKGKSYKHLWTLDEFRALDEWRPVRTGQDNYMLTVLLEKRKGD